MKDQASLNLLIVDSPIDSKALDGHLMLRATSTGVKVYDATGVEIETGGGTVDLSSAVMRYPATVDPETRVVSVTDGTPVEDVRIGDEIVTADGVYKKQKIPLQLEVLLMAQESKSLALQVRQRPMVFTF